MKKARTPNVLTILEVSQKQAYIFGDKHLSQNVHRSSLINRVTSFEYFKETPKCGFQEENRVYAGGGHTILQFDSMEAARTFVCAVTRRAYLECGIELFAKSIPYQPERSPGDNMNELVKALERKKSLRLSSFHQRGIGLELETANPADSKKNVKQKEAVPVNALENDNPADSKEAFQQIGDKKHPLDIKQLCGKDNFFAVIHLDGNGMGAKSQALTKDAGDDWDACCEKHQKFSKTIEDSFADALKQTVWSVEEQQKQGVFEQTLGFKPDSDYHPIRPVIRAGDDVTFLTPASIALECAATYLRKLDEITKGEFSACAGITMVHQKYPFHRAYNLAEDLCSSAKRYAAELGESYKHKFDTDKPDQRIATMDWHIEFGQGKDSLSAIREDYLTDETDTGTDENHPISTMTLRPLSVNGFCASPYRTYDYFVRLFSLLQDKAYPRSKVKGLREVLKTSEAGTWQYLADNQIQSLSKLSCDAEQEDAVLNAFQKGRSSRLSVLLPELAKDGSTQFVRHGLYFDAIELMDRMILFRKGEGK